VELQVRGGRPEGSGCRGGCDLDLGWRSPIVLALDAGGGQEMRSRDKTRNPRAHQPRGWTSDYWIRQVGGDEKEMTSFQHFGIFSDRAQESAAFCQRHT
jgi:hypothetical protein